MEMVKTTISYQVETKRPPWATPEVLKAMKKEGKTLQQIADIIGVTRERVRQLIKQAKKS